MPPRTNDLLETTPLAETVSKPDASHPRPASGTPTASRPIASGNRAQTSPAAHLRADALSLDVPVKVHGSRVTERPGSQPLTEPFEEETSTMIIFPQGAVLRLAGEVNTGQMLVLTNLRSKQEAICRIVKVRTYSSAQAYVEVEFTNPQTGFWGVFFPTDGPAAARKPAAEAANNPSPLRSELPPQAPRAATPVPPAAISEPALAPSGRASGPLTPEPMIPPAPQPLSALPSPASAVPVSAGPEPRPVRVSAYASDPLAAKSPAIAEAASAASRSSSHSGPAFPSEPPKPIDRPLLRAQPVFAPADSIEEFEPVAGSATFSPAAPANSRVPAARNPFGTFGPLSAGLPAASAGPGYVSPRTGRRWPVALAALALAGVAAGTTYVGVVPQNPVREAISGLLRSRTRSSRVSAASQTAPAETALAPAASNPGSQPVVPAPSEPGPVSPRLAAESSPNPAFPPKPSASAGVLTGKPTTASRSRTASAAPEIHPLSSAAPSAPVAATPRSLPTPVVSHPRFHSGIAKSAAAASAPEIDAASPVSSAPLPGVLASAGSALPPAPPPAPLRVGGDVKQPRLVSSVLPVYPIGAKNSGIEGDVVLEIVISRTGSVKQARVLSGPPILRQAALAAVRRWKYKPSELDGQPIEVLMQVTVQFRL